MIKYAIMANDYYHSQVLTTEINEQMSQLGLIEDTIAPEYIFVVGGDGTLLKAVSEYQTLLDDVCFVVIKSGSLGYYATYDNKSYHRAIQDIIKDRVHIQQLPLLEVAYNDGAVTYALNEIKILDHIKTLRTEVYLNNKLIEYFRGTGLVFSTASGSPGFMRSINGAVILTQNTKLWEIKDLAPVNNSTFSTINVPLILDSSQTIALKGELQNKTIVIDTFAYQLEKADLTIQISNKSVNLVYDEGHEWSMISKLPILFNEGEKRDE